MFSNYLERRLERSGHGGQLLVLTLAELGGGEGLEGGEGGGEWEGGERGGGETD